MLDELLLCTQNSTIYLKNIFDIYPFNKPSISTSSYFLAPPLPPGGAVLTCFATVIDLLLVLCGRVVTN
jgi:hypothetical protein